MLCNNEAELDGPFSETCDDKQRDIHYNFIGVPDMPEAASSPSSVTIDTRQGAAVEYITRKAG